MHMVEATSIKIFLFLQAGLHGDIMILKQPSETLI
jgi:hypothetical protein